MKKVLGINASPRKNWNTAQAVGKALEGATAVGAETKMIHLYSLNFKGCSSCFVCKLLHNNAKICVLKDDLQPILVEVMQSDVLILGTPIYFGNIESSMIAFFERLLFMNSTYNQNEISKFKGKIASGLICTMNVDAQIMEEFGYHAIIKNYVKYLGMLLHGPSEWMTINDTLQFKDYSQYMHGMFDPESKKRVHEQQFPRDLEKAYQLGLRLAKA